MTQTEVTRAFRYRFYPTAAQAAEYKAHGQGRTVIVVDRWLPSSKICSGCGRVKDAMPLGERVFRCERCRLVLDRDVNAARNILAAGRAVTACGAGVRPTRP